MKFVIVKTASKYFSNRLLNQMSIQAFALERGARVYNPARLENGPLRIPHAIYARIIGKLCHLSRLDAWRPPFFLPPTTSLPNQYKTFDTLYFFGWLFRNPTGLNKYRSQLLEIYQPSPKTTRTIEEIIASLQNKIRIGIHIRQQPYPGFADGDFLISIKRTREILHEYLNEHSLHIDQVAVCIVSDRQLPSGTFPGISTHVAPDNTELGFHLLASCTVVIGTNANNANLPAWFGNIPHIVVSDSPIDWSYYRDKSTFFENKYATFTQGAELP